MDNQHFSKTRDALAAWAANPALEPGVSGTFECHIFCDPLAPDEATKARFQEACDAVGLKALCLGLNFEGQGVISVLQSSRYYKCEDTRTPVALMLQDAEALGEFFNITRLKLEAVAVNPGVPVTDDEAAAVPGDTYFEYHIKIKNPPTPEGDEILKALAARMTAELGVKVPFSCNDMGGKNQRFLNARTYGMGYEASAALVERIAAAIEAEGFEVSKIIREFIVFDTNKALDNGWLEF